MSKASRIYRFDDPDKYVLIIGNRQKSKPHFRNSGRSCFIALLATVFQSNSRPSPSHSQRVRQMKYWRDCIDISRYSRPRSTSTPILLSETLIKLSENCMRNKRMTVFGQSYPGYLQWISDGSRMGCSLHARKTLALGYSTTRGIECGNWAKESEYCGVLATLEMERLSCHRSS